MYKVYLGRETDLYGEPRLTETTFIVLSKCKYKELLVLYKIEIKISSQNI